MANQETGVNKPLPTEQTVRLLRLCQYWGPEIEQSVSSLHLAIYSAAASGDFDDLVENDEGLKFVDGSTWLATYSVPSKKLGEIGDHSAFQQFALNNDLLAIHRSAVLRFASTRKLSAPSWWKERKRPQKAVTAVSIAKLQQFLEQEARVEFTEQQMKRRAQQHFTPLSVPDKGCWRPAWAALDSSKKRRAGDHARTLKARKEDQ